jgi:hypothetical protein
MIWAANRMVHNLVPVHHVALGPIFRIYIVSRRTARKSRMFADYFEFLEWPSPNSERSGGGDTLFDRCEEFFDEGFAKITHICTNCTYTVHCTP